MYLDGRQLVWMVKGYFSFRVDPGPHEIFIDGLGPDKDPVKLDARAGETYFFEAGCWGLIGSWQFKSQSEKTFMGDMKNNKPLDEKHVVMNSIVLLDPISPK